MKGKNNPFYGRHHTEETKEKVRRSVSGEKNSQWRGDNAGYHAVHRWLNRNYEKPVECEICNKKKKLLLSSKNHEYTRNIEEYQWVCRSCHQKYDHKKSLANRSGK